jgi:hypothetical protein
VKKNQKSRQLEIFCKCGEKLLKYKKGSGRRLIKIHRDRISKDFREIFVNNFEKENSDIFCPECLKRIATVKKINGKYVNKLNQGQIGDIKG